MVFTQAQLLNIGVNALLPAVVALVTARVAHPGIKAVVLLTLSAISGFLLAWQDACAYDCADFDYVSAGSTMLIGLVAAVTAHFGLLSPMKVSGSDGVIQRAVPAGIGGGKHRKPD